MPKAKPHLIAAEDLYQLQRIQDAYLSPEGTQIVFALQTVDKTTEKKVTKLWLTPTTTGKPRQITFGKWNDWHPRWSPDGRSIAFLSNREQEEQPQLYLLPIAEGGEARPLTTLKDKAIGEFAWSPNGDKFLCTIRLKDQEAITREANPEKKKLGVVARHITSTRYKADGGGYLPQEKWHIWTISAHNGKAVQLTNGRNHETDATWSPDGQSVAYLTNTHENPDLHPDDDSLFITSATSGQPRQLTTPTGFKFCLTWSPNGRYIAYIGSDKPGEWWRNGNIWIVPTDGTAPARNLTAHADINCAGHSGTDTSAGEFVPPTWSHDSQKLTFMAEQHGNICLMSVTIAEPSQVLPTWLNPTPGLIGSFSFDAQQEKIAYTYASQTHPAELYVRTLTTQKERQLTHLNTPWLRPKKLGQIEEVWFPARDGYQLHGWIMTPPHFDPTQQYPSILEIHGGPQTQYDTGFMHEFHYLATNGYVVYWSNPRGSQGYGEAHCGAIWNNWGTIDFTDVLDWVAFVRQRPYIHPQRMGVTGGSYGGYMTNMLIGREPHLFQAAVTQRSVSNLISMWGSSDANWAFQQTYGEDKPPYENLQKYWDQSPLKYIGGAQTPTLVIHSEMDFRADQEQGEQIFVALRTQGVDTELILFPEEPHGLSRTGRTDRRIARLNHILRWFDKYLKENNN
jgi:dipeptidyl aminopeptidase/acylaminoacyl peptidase